MAKISGRIRRTLSCLLAAAMIVTAVPQTGIPVYASETERMADGNNEAANSSIEDESWDTVDETDSGGSVLPGETKQDENDSEDESGSQETEPGGSASDQRQDGDNTSSDETEDDDAAKKDQQDGDEVNTDETPDDDGTDAEEQEPDEETAADTEKEELEEAVVQNYATGEESGDVQEVKKINVNINLPYYRDNRGVWIPLLAEFSYADGDTTEFTPVDLEGKADQVGYYSGKYTLSVPVEVDKDFRFKLSCKDNARLKDVTLKSKYDYNSYGNSRTLTAENNVYTITVKEQDEDSWSNVESYEIDINALQIWTITFVDLYARNHDNTASVEIYQAKRNNEGQIEESGDIAGQTVTVDSEEWDSCYYKVKTKDDFTFDSMAASVSGITINKSRLNGETAYQFEKNASVPKDITIFVTAEKTQDKILTLNMPTEVINAMQVDVYGKTPSETEYRQLELNGGTVTIRDDMAVYVKVTSNNMSYMVQATYQETGGEPEPFTESDVDTRVEDGSWTREYILGTLNHVKDGITINLSRAKVNQVRMAVNWGAVSEICVNAPVSGYYYPGDEGSGDGVTTYVPEGETLKFYVEMASDKGAACVSTEDGKEIGIDYDDTYWGTVRSYYNIVPTSDMAISVKGREYEYRFEYPEDDVSILVYETAGRDNGPEGDPLELTDHCYRTYKKSSYLWVRVKSKTNKELSVWYNNGEDRTDVERSEWYDKTEEDGSKYLCYGAIDEYWVADKTITIEGYSTNTVTFETENNLSFYKMTYDMDGDWFYEEDRIDGSVTVREGEDLYFKVKGYAPDTQRLRISMTGTDRESLESLQDEDDPRGYLVYHLVPAADTTITFTTEERKACEVVIEKSDNVKSFYADYDGDEDGNGISAAGTYSIREDGYITISDIIATGSTAEAAAKKGKVIYRIGEEPYEVLPEYNLDMQEAFYRIKVTDDMKISIDVQDTAQYTISFKDYAQLENIYVWALGTYKEKDNLYKADNGSVTLDDSGYYYFDFQLKDGVGLDSVTLTDGVGSGRILERVYLEEDSEMGYRLGMLQGDMEIVPKLVAGYTVKFDLSKLSAEDAATVEIYDSDDSSRNYLIIGQKDGKDIGSRKISFTTTENGMFYLTSSRYKLTPDSGLFKLTEVWGGNDYIYVIQPKQTEDLPKVVTISLEKYEEHNVTLDYSDEIRSISLQNIYGNKFASVENQPNVYKVYGKGAVLRVKAIDGYSPVVKIRGTGEGAELMELTPYRFADTGASEYYLDEFTEDKIIQVTVTRSAQKKTYKVGFISEGGHVTVRDSSHDTLYEVATVEGLYSADYSVMRGDKISFYVEPDVGYELQGVYANGQEVQPVRDAASQRDIYEVTPVADTQIRIDVSRIVPKYPLTFSWTNTDAIKSVKVQDYELQDNRIDVAVGTKISFTVELTDTKYSVTSVKMNGKEIPYSAGSGCYTLTAVDEPMNVEINADVADKVVRFTNTLENAQYEVETNELIRLRNGDTYLASGNADLLKFKVNVSDKMQKVGVTYINQKGVKSVLKEKGRTDLGEQGMSYSYEIAVADLPLNSEITISGEIPAGVKTELEKAISQYEGYKKSDYTEASWTAFEKALKDAQDCMEKEGATQEEIDAAISALQKAASALVKKGGQTDPETKEGLWIKEIDDQTYTGSAFKPEVEVYNGSKLLTIKKDYTVSYRNNTNAGTATVTVNGKGNYTARDTAQFEILKKDINDEDIIVSDVYSVIKSNGTVANPKVTVKFGKKTLKNGTDYKAVYPDPNELKKDADGRIVPQSCEIRIETVKVKKTGDKEIDSVNYTGTRIIRYDIVSSDTLLMSKAKVTLSASKVDYKGVDGKETEKPAVTSVKIGNAEVPADAYEVDFENWDKVGKATVTVTAKAAEGTGGTKYYGSKSVTYTVEGTKLITGQLDITGIEPAGYVYTGAPIFVSDNGAGDKGTLVIKTKGADVRTLTEGTDYTVSYKTGKVEGAHTNVGTVSVTITGIGAYTGTVKKTLKITPFDLADYSKTGSALQFAAEGDGKAKYTKTGAKPAFTLTFNNGEEVRELAEKTDYTVSYAGNSKVKAGEASATMTVKGKGNFKGSIPYKYEVTAASVDDVEAVAADIVAPDQFKKLKTTVKVIEKETGKALKAGTDYDKNFTYYIDADCQTQITADNFDELAGTKQIGVDSKIYVKVSMKEGGSYTGISAAADTASGKTPGQTVGEFRLYDNNLKISTGSKFTVKVETDKEADGIARDQKGNPIYTGKPLEPKVTVTPRGSSTPLREGIDYEVTYSNNINRGKATATVTAIGNGYGGSKSVKFTIVAADMNWAQQTVKNILDVFSGMIPAQ